MKKILVLSIAFLTVATALANASEKEKHYQNTAAYQKIDKAARESLRACLDNQLLTTKQCMKQTKKMIKKQKKQLREQQ